MSRILVVDDDPAVLRGLKDNPTFESYDVLRASDAERAYRLALCEGVLDARAQHQTGVPQHDDITVLCARIGAMAS